MKQYESENDSKGIGVFNKKLNATDEVLIIVYHAIQPLTDAATAALSKAWML